MAKFASHLKGLAQYLQGRAAWTWKWALQRVCRHQFALKWRQRNLDQSSQLLWQEDLLTAIPAAPLPGAKRSPSPDGSTKIGRLMQGHWGRRLNLLPLPWPECTYPSCQSPPNSCSSHGQGIEGSSGKSPLTQPRCALSRQKQRKSDSPLREIHEHCSSLKGYRGKAPRLTGWAVLSPFIALWHLQRGIRAFCSQV